MPLPKALLQRLAKRGLIDKNAKKRTREPNPSEEIIAEDYDEMEEPFQYDYEPVKKPRENFWSERLKRRITEGSNAGSQGCPNKYNIYHKCTLYCANTWGDGKKDPEREYMKRRARLLKRHPLPKDWNEVYDNGCGVFYYWNSVDDTVSWLPPSHPNAVVSKSAATLRRELEATLPDLDLDADDNSNDSGKFELAQVTPVEIVKPSYPPIKKPKSRDLEKALRSKSERKQLADARREGAALDPMDPASYSDIPRGSWSAGLQLENTKTGVDSTVTGALFQMRPYPSPGEILKANAKGAEKHSSASSGDENSN